MNLVKPYKLVPLHMFEKMVAAAGTTGSDSANVDNNSTNSNNDDDTINNNNKCDNTTTTTTTTGKRSIKDIIESNIDNNKTHFNPSTHFVAEFNSTTPHQQQPKQLKGKGLTDKTATTITTNKDTPLFLPGSDELPEHSKGAMIRKNYNDIVSILNESTIPESLKLKLYLMMRSKYDKTRNTPDGDNDDEISSDSGNMSALTNAASTIKAKNKQIDLKKLVTILSMQDYLSWDKYGNIISSIPGANKFDLTQVLKMILFKDIGEENDLIILSKLIRPSINKMIKEQIVHNERLLNTPYFRGYHKTEIQSRYMPW